MSKKKAYVRGKTFPELYIHLKLKEEISAQKKSELLLDLARIIDHRFWEALQKKPWFPKDSDLFDEFTKKKNIKRYSSKSIARVESIDSGLTVPTYEDLVNLSKAHNKLVNDNYGLIVELEDGSLKIRASPVGWAFLIILQAVAQYGAIRAGADTIYEDAKSAYEYVVPYIYDAIGEENIEEIIRKERRKDVVTKLEELIEKYQEGQVDRDYYLQKTLAILEKINQEAVGQELMPAVTHYLTARFGEIPEYQNLLRQLPQRPGNFPPPRRNFPNVPPELINPGGVPMIREDDDNF